MSSQYFSAVSVTTVALLLLALKMAIAATIVVSASVIAERARPFISAMVATLPISAGPTFVFLALDHDAAFVQGMLTGAMITNMATAAFCLVYAAIAQRAGTVVSLLLAFLAWVLAGFLFQAHAWDVPGALIASCLVYGATIPLARRFATNNRTLAPPRAWYAIPARAFAVACLVGVVTTLSWTLGAERSGMLAVFPIVLTSIIAILHPRIGGQQTAALIANGLIGLAGFGVALALASLSVDTLGKFGALGFGLAICVGWNGALVIWRLLRAQTVSTSPRSR